MSATRVPRRWECQCCGEDVLLAGWHEPLPLPCGCGAPLDEWREVPLRYDPPMEPA